MSEPLLGCPHCGKPVGFAPNMAGQVVACPHCRGPFQMPDRPPAPASAAPPPGPAPRKPGPAAPDDVSLSFDGGGGPAGGPPVKAELDSYRAAVTLANVFALFGTGAVLILLGLVIYAFVLPVFRGGDDHPGRTGLGLLWLVSALVFAGLGVVGLFLVRACVLVGVDAGRAMRAIERDLAAGKGK